MKNITILGGGYGGIKAAQVLYKAFRKDRDVEIVLIDRNPYHTLMTELHEVAGSRTGPEAVQIHFKRIFGGTRVNVVTDEVQEIDFEAKRLASRLKTYKYDYLVLGTGGNPEFFGVPGVQNNSHTLWSLEDAVRIREAIELRFREAAKEESENKRKVLLTFAIAGAGFTGIELAGELMERADVLCRYYHIDRGEVRIVVIEAKDSVLPVLEPKLRQKAQRYLEKKKITLMLNSVIVKAEPERIFFKSGEVLDAATFIWTAGVQASDFTSKISLTKGKVSNDDCSVASPEGIHGMAGCHFDEDETYIVGERGRLLATPYLQSVDYKNVYLAGDVIWYVHEEKVIPQIVETALQSAETVAHNIIGDIKGTPRKPFEPAYHGFMVSIGAKYAVAGVIGLKMSGFFAMAMKHLVNLHYLWGLAGLNACVGYIKEEFGSVKNRRSFIGGHGSAKVGAYWLLLLRVFVGIQWIGQSIHKLAEGWLNFDRIRIPGVTQKAAELSAGAAASVPDAANQAAEAAANAAAMAAANAASDAAANAAANAAGDAAANAAAMAAADAATQAAASAANDAAANAAAMAAANAAGDAANNAAASAAAAAAAQVSASSPDALTAASDALAYASPAPDAISAATDAGASAVHTVAAAPDNVFTPVKNAIDAVTDWLIPDKPWPVYTWFAQNVLSLMPAVFQTLIVFTELGIGLALLSGTFTWAASLASIALALMFVISGMTDVSIYWYVFAAIALMGGAGRILGLDYWIMPWLKKIWTSFGFVQRHHLYRGEPSDGFRSKKTDFKKRRGANV